MSLLRDYGQVVSGTRQYWCFLAGTPRIFTISMFYVRNPGKQWQIKINQDSAHFSACPINIVVSFAEHLKLWELKRFTRGVLVTSDKVKSLQESEHFAYWKYYI